ncbi:MAG: hypothetical protein R3C26_14200 [Calditrichia bacterium]
MVLWTIANFMTIVFLAMLLLVLFRKIQFDAVHRNFLDFEDEFGGNIDRRGFAVRPKYNGIYKGQPFAISFTSEKDQQIRRYYIVITMKGHSQKKFYHHVAGMARQRENGRRTPARRVADKQRSLFAGIAEC